MNPSDIEKFGGSAIAVIGMSGRFPGADTIDALWENLKNGVESITFFTEEELIESGIDPVLLKKPNYIKAKGILSDIEHFDAGFFGFNPREASITDVQHRIFLECSWQALENAGYVPENYDGLIGVYAGAGMNTYFLNNVYPSRSSVEIADAYQFVIANDKDFLPTITSYKLNLKGPSVCIQTACSTSLVAVHIACQGLLNGECDMALAGGVSIDVPHKSGYLYEEGMILSADGHCRAFDAKAKGTVSGNGCSIVVLKRLEDAVKDSDYIYAVIRGSAINNDGSLKVGFTAPSVEGQTDVIAEAQAVAGVEPETITYIETHGTGTILGDPIEITALTQAFKKSSSNQAHTTKTGFCAIGSVKTNIGHIDIAAGAAGLIKTVLALKNKVIPPSLNFEQPNPKIDFKNSPFYVNTKLSEWKTSDSIPRRAGVSSFGIGGTNAHVVLEEMMNGMINDECGMIKKDFHHSSFIIVLSARSEAALDQASANLAEYFRSHTDIDIADAAYTLQIGRRHFNHRRIAVCRDIRDAETVLRNLDNKHVVTKIQDADNPPVVFMFPGQGAQYVNMGAGLYQNEPVFRESVDQCAEILKPHLNLDLRHIIYPKIEEENSAANLNQTVIAQSSLFVIEYALAQLWMAWGIRPNAMIGHSIGEYTAACVAGVFSLEDALALIAERGQMMQKMQTGAMAALPVSETEAKMLIENIQGLSLSAVNSPKLCVLSGTAQAIDVLVTQLKQKGIECRRLHTSHAFHSEMMEPVVMPFASRVKQVRLNPPEIPYISNVTGTWITEQQSVDPAYWANHLRRTVRFSDGICEVLKVSPQILLEVGPGQTLKTLAMQQPDSSTNIILNSMRHPQDNQQDSEVIMMTLGKLWLSGVKIDWYGVNENKNPRRVPLPAYPFERKRCWIDTPQEITLKSSAGQTFVSDKCSKKADIADWFYIPSWKRAPLPVQSVSQIPSPCVIFSNECDICSKLISRIKKICSDLIIVNAGSHFAEISHGNYIFNPKQYEDYDALINKIAASGKVPAAIVYLWSLTYFSNSLPPILLNREECEFHYNSLLSLVQSIGKHNITTQIQMVVVSNGMQDVAGDGVLFPEKAAMLGPVKIIPLEYPNIRCRSVDTVIPEHGSIEEHRLVDQLIQEICAKADEPVIALRGIHRWVQTFEKLNSLPNPPIFEKERGARDISRVRLNGVYLITGGFGGMGLAFAEYLGKTKKAKLILVGRSAFPKRDEWETLLNTREQQDKTCIAIRKIKDIEAAGGEVLIFSADVSDEKQMQDVINQAKKSFGHINGVIHAAGVADYAGIIQRRTKEMSEKVLAPKIKGTLVLDYILKNEHIDFFILCSSLSTTLYKMNFGQVAYTSANEFLDAFVYYKIYRDKIFTVSINWDNWQEVGMSVAALKQRWGKELNLSDEMIRNFFETGISPLEGIEVFSRIIESGQPRILVSTQDLNLRMQNDISLNLKPTPGIQPKEEFERSELSKNYAGPENEIQRILVGSWQNLLGIQQIGINDNFFDLGGHSLIAVRLITQIEEVTGIKIAPAEIYTYPTIKELAEQIKLKRACESKINETFKPPLVGIQPYGEKTPFFFMHAAEGNVFCYNELSRELGMDQPCYGLKAFGIDPQTSPIYRIEDLVKTYAEAIRRVQSKGPYILGGHCLGGAIAYEIAINLKKHGEEIAHIIIIDGYAPPLFGTITKDDEVMDMLEFSQTITGPFNADIFPFYCEIRNIKPEDGIAGVYHDFQTISYEERLSLLLKCIQKTGLNLDIDLEYLDRGFRVYRIICSMFRGVCDIKHYDGAVIFFRANDEPQRPTDDPTMGWGEYLSNIKVYDIPGNHFSILAKPNVKILVDYLKKFINV